jgi:hypothetical protein
VSARQFASDAETITVTNTAGMVTEGTMNRGVERRFDTGNRMRWSVFLGAFEVRNGEIRIDCSP